MKQDFEISQMLSFQYCIISKFDRTIFVPNFGYTNIILADYGNVWVCVTSPQLPTTSSTTTKQQHNSTEIAVQQSYHRETLPLLIWYFLFRTVQRLSLFSILLLFYSLYQFSYCLQVSYYLLNVRLPILDW